jgi:hypothetical protein
MEFLVFDGDGEFVEAISFNSDEEREAYLKVHPGYYFEEDEDEEIYDDDWYEDDVEDEWEEEEEDDDNF